MASPLTNEQNEAAREYAGDSDRWIRINEYALRYTHLHRRRFGANPGFEDAFRMGFLATVAAENAAASVESIKTMIRDEFEDPSED